MLHAITNEALKEGKRPEVKKKKPEVKKKEPEKKVEEVNNEEPEVKGVDGLFGVNKEEDRPISSS